MLGRSSGAPRLLSLLAAVALASTGCEADSPTTEAPVDSAIDVAPDAPPDALADADAATDSTSDVAPEATPDAPPACPAQETIVARPASATCTPSAGAFVAGTSDGWAACISDDGAYHSFNASVSSIARVDAFERIAVKLGFGTDKAPTPTDFVDAKVIFAEDQGLGSRLERREDEHFPAAPAACNTLSATDLALHPDRCVGPAKLLPLVNAAFAAGAAGTQPRENAARLEAAFLWFFYVSPYKESRTCAATVADCDSAWAYYTGGDPKSAGKGFARYVRAREPQTHDAIWSGILAVRCWRDLDNPTGAAADLVLRDKAVAQLDRGLGQGLAAILRQRIQTRACASTWPGTQLLGQAIARDAKARDATKAAALAAELAKGDPAAVDEAAALAALDAMYPCGL